MGFLNRLLDFGDRAQVQTLAHRIFVGIQQIEEETNIMEIRGLSTAVKQEVDNMLNITSRLTIESLSCLNIEYNGYKIPYFTFLSRLSDLSEVIVRKGGHPII